MESTLGLYASTPLALYQPIPQPIRLRDHQAREVERRTLGIIEALPSSSTLLDLLIPASTVPIASSSILIFVSSPQQTLEPSPTHSSIPTTTSRTLPLSPFIAVAIKHVDRQMTGPQLPIFQPPSNASKAVLVLAPSGSRRPLGLLYHTIIPLRLSRRTA
ncbi:hypothetical protein K402DRAFT_397381 [Aulographum hederae CBS 113979]|uniref:Uncharacterized protein n=1 Tax=Aulographum hederae CBS 113979 TaxID=1176131 RepID=A0A6G1GNY5_9PEZI|nr:hypothetical protein K402DRAFT_397381 [Aulographum hederae CBS 113979]